MKKLKKLFWLYIAYIYGLFGITWIIFSDYFLSILKLSNSQIQIYSNIKGFFFILLTTWLLWYIGKKHLDHDQLKQEKEKLDMLINAMPDFVVFKDHEGRWLQVNQFGLELFELDGVDYRGKKDSELARYTDFYKEALMYCETSDAEAWEKITTSRCLETIPMRDGSFKFFDAIKVPMFHNDGSRKGILVIGRDISDLKRTEEALLKTEKLVVVGELAAGIAHEIRNPLTSMKGFLQLVKEKTIPIESCQDLIIDEIERINDIVTELLMLGKPQIHSFEQMSVKEVIQNTVNLMSTEANLKNVTLSVNIEKDFKISCSANQLKQVFINIIKNSIDSISKKGKVQIKLMEENDNELRIRFQDNGCGMDQERLKRIGEPFYSVKEKGIGLGMTVSFKIIKEHGGRVELQSEVGEGTIVDVILPKSKMMELQII